MLEADKTLKHFWLDKNINTYFKLLAIAKNSIIHKLPVYHLTWFGSTDSSDNFDYIHAASIISAANVTNGTAEILLHTNIPEKIWLKNDLFSKTVGSLTTIVYLKSPPELIFGHFLRKGEHVSDVYRILLLLLFPGTYADLDMAMVHHYEPEFIKTNDKHTSQVHLGTIHKSKGPCFSRTFDPPPFKRRWREKRVLGRLFHHFGGIWTRS